MPPITMAHKNSGVTVGVTVHQFMRRIIASLDMVIFCLFLIAYHNSAQISLKYDLGELFYHNMHFFVEK